MKKKFLAVLLTAAMAVSMFAGCGAKEVPNLEETLTFTAGIPSSRTE